MIIFKKGSGAALIISIDASQVTVLKIGCLALNISLFFISLEVLQKWLPLFTSVGQHFWKFSNLGTAPEAIRYPLGDSRTYCRFLCKFFLDIDNPKLAHQVNNCRGLPIPSSKFDKGLTLEEKSILLRCQCNV
jgi:hypothetical protein